MKVKMFEERNASCLEEKVSNFLDSLVGEIKYIKMTSGGHGYIAIAIFYTE